MAASFAVSFGALFAPLLLRFGYWFRPYGGSLLANAPEVTKRSCPLHPGLAALDLIRCAHPAGQPSAVTSLRSVSSFHHCSRGRRTRAVHGPLRLSPHPCGSLPSTTIPLGLLMGRLASSARLWASDKKAKPALRRMGGAERYPCGRLITCLMGIASLNPSYGSTAIL